MALTDIYESPPARIKHGDRLKNDRYPIGTTISKLLENSFEDIQDAFNGNKYRVIDSMTYASTALALAAWVPVSTSAVTGMTITRDITLFVEDTSAVLFTVGSAFAAAVKVTKTLTGDKDTYPTDGVAYQDWSGYNYLGLFQNAVEAHAATDIDLIITDRNGNDAIIDFAAVDANHITMLNTYDVALADFTTATGFDWSGVASITLEFNGVTMGNDEAITIDQICIYKYSNGFGPVRGSMTKGLGGEASIVRGLIMKHDPTGGFSAEYVSANDGDEEACYIACSDAGDGDELILQKDGMFIGELAVLTSLEVGDAMGCADAAGLTWTEAVNTDADSVARYIGPIKTAAAQYVQVWMQLTASGATQS